MLRAFLRNTRGAAALEFAILALPFLVFILAIMQVGLYYITQAALDNGVLRTAEQTRVGFATGASETLPSALTLKASVAQSAGALVPNNSNLAVEMRQLSTLAAGDVAIADGTVDLGAATSPLVLRAKTKVIIFAPGFSSLTWVTSSAMVRRLGR
jgi:Flp pilus assembly protein TadG